MDPKKTVTEYWKCDICKRGSNVTFHKRAGVQEVFALIFYDHQQVSPDCAADKEDIRMVDPPRKKLARRGDENGRERVD